MISISQLIVGKLISNKTWTTWYCWHAVDRTVDITVDQDQDQDQGTAPTLALPSAHEDSNWFPAGEIEQLQGTTVICD